MRRDLDADVIVAGAGPAGAATAIHLCKQGVRVLLLDGQHFPRDKVCGDFLSAVALRELQTLGVAAAIRRHSNVIRDAAVWLDGRHLISSPLPRVPAYPLFGRVVPRKALDDLLVRQAIADGARFAQGHRVVAWRAMSRCVEVTVHAGRTPLRLRARALVGADGSTSVVARQLPETSPHALDRLIAVRAYFSGVGGPPDRADLYFSSKTFPGYAWLFPTGHRTANVGVGMVLKTLPPSTEHLPTLLKELVRSDPALRERLRGAVMSDKIAAWPLATYNGGRAVATNRVVLVGDAAGLINPLNGEGIQYALLSARWAGETLASCLGRGAWDRSALEPYGRRVAAELRADLGLSRLIVDLIRNRALSALWLEALQTIAARARVDPAYATVTGGVLAGVVPAQQVLALDVVRRTLAQAFRRTIDGTLSLFSRGDVSFPRLAVALTDAAVASARSMVEHRDDSRQWFLHVGRAAVDAALPHADLTPVNSGTRRTTRRRGTSSQEERQWREGPEARRRGQTQQGTEAERRRARGVPADRSVSKKSTPRLRK